MDTAKRIAVASGLLGGGALGVHAGAEQAKAINADQLSPRVGRAVAELPFANMSSSDILSNLQTIDSEIQTIASNMTEGGKNDLESSYKRAKEALGRERLVGELVDHDLTLQQIDAVGELYQLLLKIREDSSSKATSEAAAAAMAAVLSILLSMNSALQGKRS